MSTAVAFRAFAYITFTIAAAFPSYAQHPYLWFDSTQLDLMREKVASSSADWLALRAQCDAIAGVKGGAYPSDIAYPTVGAPLPYSVVWPHATNGGDSRTRFTPPYVPPYAFKVGNQNFVYTGFTGGLWDETQDQLGACYQAIRTTDPIRAAAYLAEEHQIIQAMAQPWWKMVRQSDGLTRYGISVDKEGNDLLAGAPMEIQVITYSTPKNAAPAVGDVWTISAPANSNVGCTNLIGTWKVASISGWQLMFENTNGSPAPPLNANCTLYSVSLMNTGDDRFYMPAMAKAYDWFYGDSSYGGLSVSYPGDITLLQQAMWSWLVELSYDNYHSAAGSGVVPEENFAYGSIWALTAVYVAFNADCGSGNKYCPDLGGLAIGTGASMGNVSNTLNARLNSLVAYHKRWMFGGGNGEGLHAYGYDSIERLIAAEYAMWLYQTTSDGEYGADWRSESSYNFSFLDEQLQYFMEFASPTLLSEDDNEFVYPVGTSYFGNYEGQWFPTEVVWIPLSQMVFFTTVAARMGSGYAPQFQDWYNAAYAAEYTAAGTIIPQWSSGVYKAQPAIEDQFLWFNSGAPTADWTTIPLMYRAWGGNYAVTRTVWNHSTATEVTLLGGPTVGAAGNGKTQFDSGAITIQTGNNRLLVYGLGEASRAADLINLSTWQTLDNERSTYGNKKNSIFWAGPNPGQYPNELHNQGLTSRVPPPGQSSLTTSWPGSIDRAEDETNYSYLRANHLEASNAKASDTDQQYHQALWVREILFLRPNLVIVHDRTSTLYPTDDRAMFWTFPRTPVSVTADVPSGMTRYDVTDQNRIYRGAYFQVLPASANVTIVDHDDLHFLYRAEARPTSLDHTNDDWLAVFDAATSAADVNSVTSVPAVNADAVQFNDSNSSIVAFANEDPYTTGATLKWPVNGSLVQYIAGLTPGASYGISSTGGNIIVFSGGPYQASAAGVLAQTVSMSGTGTTALIAFAPTNLTFNNQLVGTTSNTQAVTLSNNGTASLSISGITFTGPNAGDFAQTNNCGTSVAARANCTINVNFTPTAAGARSASIFVTDNASGSPQTVSVSATGMDFSFSAASGGSTSATVTAGQTATYDLQLNPAGNFSGTVNLACSGAPAQANCSVSLPSAPVKSTSAVRFKVTVTTSGPTAAAVGTIGGPYWSSRGPSYVFLRSCVLFALITVGTRSVRRKRVWARMGALACLTVGLVACAGVSNSSGGGGIGSSGTPAGTYNLTITGTAQGASRTLILRLTVD